MIGNEGVMDGVYVCDGVYDMVGVSLLVGVCVGVEEYVCV